MAEMTTTEREQREWEADQRSGKIRALAAMLRVMPKGQDGIQHVDAYLQTCAHLTCEEFAAGCEVLQDTWTDTFTYARPSHLKNEGDKFRRKNKTEIKAEQARLRMQHMSTHWMSPKSILAELERMEDPTAMVDRRNPYNETPESEGEVRARAKYIAALERILAEMEGKMDEASQAKREAKAVVDTLTDVLGS